MAEETAAPEAEKSETTATREAPPRSVGADQNLEEMLRRMHQQHSMVPEVEATTFDKVAAGFDVLFDTIRSAYRSARSLVHGSFELNIGGFSLKTALAPFNRLVGAVVPSLSKRRYVVGFGPIEVPPGEMVTVSVPPEELFRGEKIISTCDETDLFIRGLFVGSKPQLPTFENAIALKTFNSHIVDNEIIMDACPPGVRITFQIENQGVERRIFAATICGHVVIQ